MYSSISSSSFIPIANRMQYNTVCMTNITNSRVVINIVMWFCWWPPEKPCAYQAGSHINDITKIYRTLIHPWFYGAVELEKINYWRHIIVIVSWYQWYVFHNPEDYLEDEQVILWDSLKRRAITVWNLSKSKNDQIKQLTGTLKVPQSGWVCRRGW